MITIYTTGPSCMQCTMTKRAFLKAAMKFEEVNVRENEAAMAYIQDELHYDQAPVVVVSDEDHWAGFQPAEIERVSAAAKGRSACMSQG